MQLPLGFGNLDFSDWFRGVISAFVGGGAGAVSGGIAVNLLDPKDWNLQTGKFYTLVGSIFAINGLLNLMAFLRVKPIPDLKPIPKLAPKP